MRRPSLTVGIGTLAVLGSLLVPTTAHAVDAKQSLVVNGTAVTWTPQVLDGQVNAIAAVGSEIVIGGTFTQVKDSTTNGSTLYARTYMAAFDAATGKIDPAFNPTFGGITQDELDNGHAIDALATNGANVVVGGVFSTVDGVTQHGITELSLSGSRVASFTADLTGTNKQVGALVVNGGKVYVGGKFDKVNGLSRSSLAVLNATTGAVLSLNLPVTGTVQPGAAPSVVSLDVTPDGGTLVVGGNFTTVGGVSRTQLAMIDAVAGKATTWQTSRFVTPCMAGVSDVKQLDISPDGTYVVVVAGGGPMTGSLCDAASRWEAGRLGSGQQPTWVDSTGGDTLTSVAVTGSAVYVGGHQRWVNNFGGVNSNVPGAVDRKMAAALDPATGLPLSWNPGVTRGGQGIYDMLATAAGLWLGSDETVAFGAGRARLAFFPLAGGTTVPHSSPQTLPNVLYTTTASNGLNKRSCTGLAFGAGSPVPSPGGVAWGSVNGAFMLAGSIYYGTTNGVLHKAPFDGSTVGASSTVDTFWSTSGVSSFTYGAGRLYYVIGGALYFRWFSNQSDVVGTEQVTLATSGYAGASEMFVAGGSLYFAKPDHKLYRVVLSAANGAPTGTVTAVSGPGIDTLSWTDAAALLSSSAVRALVRMPGSGGAGTSTGGAGLGGFPPGRRTTGG